jgi:CPA2 family monovalent cation:H+ antiporter-2
MILVELGAIFLGLALVHRLAHRLAFSPIPLVLLVGLAFGEGGLLALRLSEPFVRTTAEIGALLLLFMLGLEYSGRELWDALRAHFPDSLVDAFLNFTPGFLLALTFGWGLPLAGILAHLIDELGWEGRAEARVAVSLSILEDLLIALLLPPVMVLFFRTDGVAVGPLLLSLLLPVAAMGIAIRYGQVLIRAIDHENEAVLLLSLFGLVLLAGGIALALRIPAAVGAFLLGIAISDPVKERARRLIGPVRDLSATVFFLTLGLRTDPGLLLPVLPLAVLLALATGLTKGLTGWIAAHRAGIRGWARARAGALLIARGELSGVIAGLVGLTLPTVTFVPLATAYVLLSALLGPLVVHRLPREG